ncbi:putative uncharacterized protein TRPC5OS [Fukomys damarensis]|uniref:putative uncharacterized protein TRPC5OS n=1 Tax=Fukomys damarensis TaxID=885580 RepID=UPI00053F6266|nr:putative uncharacterized protein TRPC5OS [Fukomys damarensis]XP_010601393.1 putative uncharacterized protein TRPC5OS [Fukomys damarensis]XP_010601394.1 putative uncharacterized protein TRPC5OS [Fukomys damarensis]
MQTVSVPALVAGLIDCIAQLTRIAEEILHFISQGQPFPCVEQDNREEQAEAEEAPPEEAPLPDLANFSDLESILSLREDDELVLDVDQALLDIGDLNEDLLPDINNNTIRD